MAHLINNLAMGLFYFCEVPNTYLRNTGRNTGTGPLFHSKSGLNSLVLPLFHSNIGSDALVQSLVSFGIATPNPSPVAHRTRPPVAKRIFTF